MANKFDALADEVLKLIGGEENITIVNYCATRLRFNVKNRDLVQFDELKKVKGVINALWSADQLQLVIGTEVKDAYDAVMSKIHLSDNAAEGSVPAVKKKKTIGSILAGMVSAVADCFIPLMPGITACGLVKVVLIIGNMLGWIATESPTYQVLEFVGDTAFYFLPIFVGGTAAKRFGGSVGMGLVIGGILMNPTFLAAVADGTPLSVFGLSIPLVNYKQTLIPTVMCVYVMSQIEKFLRKHLPTIIKSMLAPLLTMLVMVPLSLCVIAPIGNTLGVYVSTALVWFYDHFGFIAVSVMAVIYPIFVMFGMQKSMIPYLGQSFATLGHESFMLPASYVANFNQAVAGFAVGLKTKNDDVKSLAFANSFTCVFGPTEPVMYGINLRFKTPFYCVLVGNAVGGAIAGLGKVASYVMGGGGGILIITTYLPGGTANVVWLLAATLAGAVVTFVLTMIFYKDKAEE